MNIEIIGTIASILLIISMCFKTETIKGSIWMRIFNIVGSVIFATYGFLLPAYSTGCLNTIMVGVNAVRLVKLLKEKKVE